MNIFYVYVYIDPRKPGKYKYGEYEFDYEPFYVGKGCFGKSYIDRIDYHWKSIKKFLDENNNLIIEKVKKLDGNLHKINLINKLMKSNYNPNNFSFKFIENISQEEAYKIEERMITIIGRRDKGKGPLLNLTDGGEFHRFVKPWNKGLTKENDNRLRKLSEARKGKGNPMFGCCGIDNPLFGKKRLISPMKGKNHKSETKLKMKLSKEKYLYIVYENEKEIERTFSLKDFCQKYKINYDSFKLFVRNGKKYKNKYFVKRFIKEKNRYDD